MSFKKDFMWGVASAAYQIEGAAFEDGKGLSIWDVYSHIPGKIKEEHNGDVACDHYNKYKEDIALMRELSVPTAVCTTEHCGVTLFEDTNGSTMLHEGDEVFVFSREKASKEKQNQVVS